MSEWLFWQSETVETGSLMVLAILTQFTMLLEIENEFVQVSSLWYQTMIWLTTKELTEKNFFNIILERRNNSLTPKEFLSSLWTSVIWVSISERKKSSVIFNLPKILAIMGMGNGTEMEDADQLSEINVPNLVEKK